MPIIKSRPRISLRIPRIIHPGDNVEVVALLDAKKAVPVESIDLWLTGSEWSAIGTGKSRRVFRLPLLRQRARLRETGELVQGHSELPARFALPAQLPPALDTSDAGARYELELHVSIPWWPDAKRSFVLPVTLAAVAIDEPPARIHTSRVGGPLKREAHVEFSLDSMQLVPGQALRGQLALYNVAHNRYRVAELALVAYIERRDERGKPQGSFEAHRYSIQVRIEDTEEGAAIPFGMQLPANLEPSFAARLWTLRWHFELTLKIAWGSNLGASTQVVVLPIASTSRAGAVRATQIGSGRVLAIWQRVAQEQGYQLSDGVLYARFDTATVAISIDRSGDYVSLRAVLGYPSIGIGLDGGTRSGLQRVFQRSIEVDGGRWDSDHYLTSREPAQARAFVAPLAAVLVKLLAEDIEDETMTLARRGGGQSYRHLADFVSTVTQLAASLREARAAVPPPACMHHAVDQWRQLASSLLGNLQQADMSVAGQFEGRDAQVRTVWSNDDAPLYTELILFTAQAVSERHQLAWSRRVLSGSPDELSQPARQLYDQLIGVVQSLTIGVDRLVVWQAAPASETGALLDRLGQLDALDRALEAKRGPYR